MRGLERLRRAKERLDGAEGTTRDRLREAACEFVVAAISRESWPVGLRIEAERVRAGLLACGVVEGGADDLDSATVAEMQEALRRVCERAERRFRGTTSRSAGREPLPRR